MKYLKSISEALGSKNYSRETMKIVFESKIHWDMIDDAIDMSHEYRDDGIQLNINILYDYRKNNGEMIPVAYFMHDNQSVTSYGGGFLSDKDLQKLPRGLKSLEPIDEDKMIYDIFLSHEKIDTTKMVQELVKRLQTAYPDLKIVNKENED